MREAVSVRGMRPALGLDPNTPLLEYVMKDVYFWNIHDIGPKNSTHDTRCVEGFAAHLVIARCGSRAVRQLNCHN